MAHDRLDDGVDVDVSADLDAYRRHRGTAPAKHASVLASLVDAIRPSPLPQVFFSRVTEAVCDALADGCQVELSDGADPPLSVLARRSGSCSAAAPDPAGVVEVTFDVSRQGDYPSYAGVLTIWWNDRPAAVVDRVVAELLVRHVVGSVDRQRLMERAEVSEARAAASAMDAIGSRQLNLAIGITMGRDQCSAADAEAVLVDRAAERAEQLYTVAAETVRAANLSARPPANDAEQRERMHLVRREKPGDAAR